METENRNLKKEAISFIYSEFAAICSKRGGADGPIVLIWMWICIEYEHCLLLQFSGMILRNLFFLHRYFDNYSFIWPIGSSKWCFKESQLYTSRIHHVAIPKRVYMNHFSVKIESWIFVGIWKLYHGHHTSKLRRLISFEIIHWINPH